MKPDNDIRILDFEKYKEITGCKEPLLIDAEQLPPMAEYIGTVIEGPLERHLYFNAGQDGDYSAYYLVSRWKRGTEWINALA